VKPGGGAETIESSSLAVFNVEHKMASTQHSNGNQATLQSQMMALHGPMTRNRRRMSSISVGNFLEFSEFEKQDGMSSTTNFLNQQMDLYRTGQATGARSSSTFALDALSNSFNPSSAPIPDFDTFKIDSTITRAGSFCRLDSFFGRPIDNVPHLPNPRASILDDIIDVPESVQEEGSDDESESGAGHLSKRKRTHSDNLQRHLSDLNVTNGANSKNSKRSRRKSPPATWPASLETGTNGLGKDSKFTKAEPDLNSTSSPANKTMTNGPTGVGAPFHGLSFPHNINGAMGYSSNPAMSTVNDDGTNTKSQGDGPRRRGRRRSTAPRPHQISQQLQQQMQQPQLATPQQFQQQQVYNALHAHHMQQHQHQHQMNSNAHMNARNGMLRMNAANSALAGGTRSMMMMNPLHSTSHSQAMLDKVIMTNNQMRSIVPPPPPPGSPPSPHKPGSILERHGNGGLLLGSSSKGSSSRKTSPKPHGKSKGSSLVTLPTADVKKEIERHKTEAESKGKTDLSLSTKPKPLTSKYKGVCWYKRTQKWVVQIKQQGIRAHVGYFTDEVEAAEAYQTAMEAIKSKIPAKEDSAGDNKGDGTTKAAGATKVVS